MSGEEKVGGVRRAPVYARAVTSDERPKHPYSDETQTPYPRLRRHHPPPKPTPAQTTRTGGPRRGPQQRGLSVVHTMKRRQRGHPHGGQGPPDRGRHGLLRRRCLSRSCATPRWRKPCRRWSLIAKVRLPASPALEDKAAARNFLRDSAAAIEAHVGEGKPLYATSLRHLRRYLEEQGPATAAAAAAAVPGDASADSSSTRTELQWEIESESSDEDDDDDDDDDDEA